jgi:hypothetical protein
MTDFPQSAKVSELARTASEYDQFLAAWTTFSELYKGGAVLLDAVTKRGQYLRKKPKELSEVYSTRQLGFSYTNLLGNIVGWYGAALFKQPPQLIKRLENAKPAVDGKPAAALPDDVTDFCAGFEADCDNGGTTFIDFSRGIFEFLMLHKAAYVLIDLPALDGGLIPANLLQQQRAGALDGYLVLYEPSQIINWETDAYGNLEWCVIHIACEERAFLAQPKLVDYYYYFDRQQVAMYRAQTKEGAAGSGQGVPPSAASDSMAVLCEGYPRNHALADQNRVPIHKLEVPDGLWLANRVYLPLLNHLNLDNAFDFGLSTSALAQLVIEDGLNGMKYETPVAVSEVGYHSVPNGGSMYYLEPEGRAYNAIESRLDILEQRIYKSCYLMDQARSNKATPAAQSGISKQQDKIPSGDALSAFGDVVRAGMQAIYSDVLAIRGMENVIPDVRGFDFEDKAGIEELEFLEKSTVIDIQSDIYRRERDKKFVRVILPDANPDVLQAIDDQITANPTPEGAAEQQAEEQRATQLQGFTAALQSGSPGSS